MKCPKSIDFAIRKIETLDRKIKPLNEEASAIAQTAPFCQPPPVYGRILDKINRLKAKQAEIWNEELRNKLFEGQTLWQRALKDGLPAVRFGKEDYLDFTGEDIRRIVRVSPEPPNLLDGWAVKPTNLNN